MNLSRTLLEDFLQDVEVFAASDPDSEELQWLLEQVEGLISDAVLRG